jgi:NADH-quinone oxidoreductase subunit N
VPPFAGFVGKVYLLLAVIKKGPSLYWLAVVAVINTVISLYYYARVIKLMFLSRRMKGAHLSGMTAHRSLSYALLGALTALTLLLGVYWTPLDLLSRVAMNFLN